MLRVTLFFVYLTLTWVCHSACAPITPRTDQLIFKKNLKSVGKDGLEFETFACDCAPYGGSDCRLGCGDGCCDCLRCVDPDGPVGLDWIETVNCIRECKLDYGTISAWCSHRAECYAWYTGSFDCMRACCQSKGPTWGSRHC